MLSEVLVITVLSGQGTVFIKNLTICEIIYNSSQFSDPGYAPNFWNAFRRKKCIENDCREFPKIQVVLCKNNDTL